MKSQERGNECGIMTTTKDTYPRSSVKQILYNGKSSHNDDHKTRQLSIPTSFI